MANSRPARQRRREALLWVLDHLPDPEAPFTTHDVLAVAEGLQQTTWPPYLKSAWRHVASRQADSIGMALSRHPSVEKLQGVENRERHGVRTRSQRWQRRQQGQ